MKFGSTDNAKFDQRMMVQTCRNYGLPKFEFVEWHCAMKKYAQFWGEYRKNGSFRQQSLTNACIQQDIVINGGNYTGPSAVARGIKGLPLRAF